MLCLLHNTNGKGKGRQREKIDAIQLSVWACLRVSGSETKTTDVCVVNWSLLVFADLQVDQRIPALVYWQDNCLLQVLFCVLFAGHLVCILHVQIKIIAYSDAADRSLPGCVSVCMYVCYFISWPIDALQHCFSLQQTAANLALAN